MNSDRELALEQQIAQMTQAFADFKTFVSRRFDEVSMEVNATGQLLGMAEEGITERFSEVLGVLGSVSYQGDESTSHNVGLQLDSVVKATEEAANKILDAADKITELTQAPIDWSDAAARDVVFSMMGTHIGDIMSACAFQDLAGQRIAQTLGNIRKAEEDLSKTLESIGVKVDTQSTTKSVNSNVKENTASSQDEIDALFS
jgi:chemotaxis protein CheZ